MTASKRGERSRPRDQDVCGFTPILEALLRRVAGASGVALVDNLGETVDYAGGGDPFEIRVAGAQLQLLYTPSGALGGAGMQTLAIRAEKNSYFVHALPDGCGLTIVLRRRCFWVSPRALDVAEAALREEAGWERVRPQWAPVQVQPTDAGVPGWLTTPAGQARVTVLGRLANSPRGERAYRVQIDATYEEWTLVREAAGFWYAESQLA